MVTCYNRPLSRLVQLVLRLILQGNIHRWPVGSLPANILSENPNARRALLPDTCPPLPRSAFKPLPLEVSRGGPLITVNFEILSLRFNGHFPDEPGLASVF